MLIAQKIKSNNKVFIYMRHPVDMLTYDRLYENMPNLDHFRWKEFKEKQAVKSINLIKDLGKIKKMHKNKVYWFFKDRTDKRNIQFSINNTAYTYLPNTLLACKEDGMVTHSNLENDYQDKPVIELIFN